MSYMTAPAFFMAFDGPTGYEQLDSDLHYPSAYPQYQTLVEFKDDILYNWHVRPDENSFIQCMYPLGEQTSSPSSAHDILGWGGFSSGDGEQHGGASNDGATSKGQLEKKNSHNVHFNSLQLTEANGKYICGSQSTVCKPRRRRSPNNRTGTGLKMPAGETARSKMPGSKPRKSCKRLTIEQKRTNHIRHEQKRRGLIRDGFKDLTQLIPELRGGTWSRSRILSEAAELLQALLESNEALQESLDILRSCGRGN